MRIVIDARYVSDHFPGIGRYVYNLLQALGESAQQHQLLVLHNPALRNTRHDLRLLERAPTIELVTSDAPPFSLAEQIRIPQLLRALRADLYHAPYYVRPYAGLPCPSLVTLYDAIPHLFPHEVSARARLLFNLLTRLAIRSARRVIAISQSARADLIAAYRIPPERIVVTPLAADPRFRPQPSEVIERMRAAYRLGGPYILALGSNKPHKNLPALVEAFGQLRGARAGVRLVIAGHWDPRYPQARELAARLGLSDAVQFLPDAAEADLPALLSGAEIFAFPSLYEGFGLPPLEALACGVPVLCGSSSSIPEVVGDAAIRVDTRDTAAIADGLTQLLADPALRGRLREAGPQRAAQFSWHRTAELTLSTYLQLIG